MHSPVRVSHAIRSTAGLCVLALVTLTTLVACTGGAGSVSGNEQGSEPINASESVEYQKAVVRCYKTGGTRVVKIMGQLRCY